MLLKYNRVFLSSYKRTRGILIFLVPCYSLYPTGLTFTRPKSKLKFRVVEENAIDKNTITKYENINNNNNLRELEWMSWWREYKNRNKQIQCPNKNLWRRNNNRRLWRESKHREHSRNGRGRVAKTIKTRGAKSAGSNGILAQSLLKLNDPKVGGAEF